MRQLLAWLNTLVPLLAVGGGYGIALWQAQAPVCFPFWEGCTSISRAVREGDSLFWFRGLMLPLTPLLAGYWLLHRRWLNELAGTEHRYLSLAILAVISAFALALYANFLGSEGDVYRFMRRFGITFYFAFGLLGQLLALAALNKQRVKLSGGQWRWVRAQWACVIAQWLLGLASLAITISQPYNKYELHNLVEWYFALAMVLFYGLNGLIWRDSQRPL